MRISLATALLCAACVTKVEPFVCSDSTQCSGGTCEPAGFCSVVDPSCGSGRRYVAEAGDLAGVCVGQEPPDGGGGQADARIDTVPGACGDGVVNTGEDCDDGNADQDDGCIDCAFARCGDGHVRAAAEQCDDGNAVDDDACTNGCVECTGGNDTLGADGHCYIRVDTPSSWDVAAAACEAMGAHLAIYSTMAESTAAGGWLPAGTGFWIALNDRQDEDVFTWGAELLDPAQTDWAPGEPQNAQNLDCVRQESTGWIVSSCGTELGYVCEKDPWLVRTGTTHAYFVAAALGSWQEAHTACTAQPPAHLATITSTGEQDFVRAGVRARAWLGGQDMSMEGTFVWVNGDDFTSYTNWASGQPDDAPGGSADCIAMLAADGTWEDGDCGGDAAWICEVD